MAPKSLRKAAAGKHFLSGCKSLSVSTKTSHQLKGTKQTIPTVFCSTVNVLDRETKFNIEANLFHMKVTGDSPSHIANLYRSRLDPQYHFPDETYRLFLTPVPSSQKRLEH